jgi:hypothetical protein
LSLSTEGNQPIPHELTDQAISWSRSQELVFFFLSFDFPLIGFKLDDDLLEIAPLLPCNLEDQVWLQLVLIWPQIG